MPNQNGPGSRSWNKYFGMLKNLLGIEDDERDAVLNIYFEMAMQSVLNYINRTALPPELYLTVVRLAQEAWLINETAEADDEKEGNVNSVGLAGATISYGLSSAKVAILKSWLDNKIQWLHELRQFRSLFRVAYVGQEEDG